MCRIYKDTPNNFIQINPYIVINSADIIKTIVQAEKCYFYDTCAFRKHMMVVQPDAIFNYIKDTNGVVVITRCIIMELCGGNNELWNEHIEYIKKIHQFGIKVVIIFEEEVMNILVSCYTGNTTINGMLSTAIKYAKSKTGTVETVLSSDDKLKKELLINNNNTDITLATRFFIKVRSNKTSGDNLGEELIAICLHLLSNIRESQTNKYIVLTDDKGAITLLSKTIQNVEKHIGMRCIVGVTTAKLCWLIANSTDFISKEQIEDILGNATDDIKVFCSEEYELSPSEKTMKVGELANKLIDKNIKIYF